jgi:hypothetical protein
VRLDSHADVDKFDWAGYLGDRVAVGPGAMVDEGSAADPPGHEALGLELAQRFAHGAARGAEMVSQVALGGKAGPIGVGPVEDRLVQPRGNGRRSAGRGFRQIRRVGAIPIDRGQILPRVANHFHTFENKWFTFGSKYAELDPSRQ